MNLWTFAIVAAGLMQGTLLSHFSVLGVHPNLVLVLATSWSLLRGGRDGLLWGLVGGVVLDLFSSAPFGTFTISMLVMTFATGLLERSVFSPTIVLPVAVMVIIAPLFHILAAVMMQTLGWKIVWSQVASLLLPVMIVDSMLILAFFPLMRRASKLAGQRAIEWS